MNYFLINALSNSDLTALARAYNALPDNRAELEDIFNFGSLVDAHLTEPWRIDYADLVLNQEGGEKVIYTPEVFQLARELSTHCKKDPVVAAIIKQMVGQYIFVRNLTFEYEADLYTIKSKCKFDAYGKLLAMSADYKTTACTSKKQFREAIDFFHWDRQGAFYMDLGKTNRHWIIGISKKTGEVFKHAIERGDATYTRGRDKYVKWAYRWQLLGMDEFIRYTLEQKLNLVA